MKKLNTARILMAISILLIIVFQGYWMKKLYKEEKRGFEKSADLIFRESIYRLQSDRFRNDTMIFRGIPGDDLFMADVLDAVKGKRLQEKDSTRKFVITMNTNMHLDDNLIRDTTLLIHNKIMGMQPPNLIHYLKTNKLINDTIPIKRIDSLYSILLGKAGINIIHRIDFSSRHDLAKSENEFITTSVPVGLINPLFYHAIFPDTRMHILKSISTPFLLSVLLILLTSVSFIFIYRSLLAQRKLTAIKNEFIGNITHELKTPIATVSVAIEAMKNFNVLENAARTNEYLGIATQELNRLSLLVDKVLRLSMFESKQVELHRQDFDLTAVVEEVCISMQLQFDKCQAIVNSTITGNNFMLHADRMHIMSVIYNLLDNAIKYCNGSPQITIAIKDEKDSVSMRISDNGMGIGSVYIDRVFEKFFRVPHGDMHNVKGYGLGLSYASHIIARHGGTIYAESDGKTGTAFIINIPRKNAG